MAEFKKINLEIDHKYDSFSRRHYLNGNQTVYHCHHFTTLYTQLAIDAKETELISNCSEQSFYKVLKTEFEKLNLCNIQDKIEVAKQYYSAFGLGVIEVKSIGEFSAVVESPNSHIDQGWISKWGKYDKPVNYIGCGYISAMLSAIFNAPVGSFNTIEVNSIVKGDDKSVFKSIKK